MITGTDNLRDIFSIFHDGTIVNHELVPPGLRLEVEILYLAQRVHPQYRGFRVELHNAREISFATWPSDLNAPATQMDSLADIFAPQLDILGCEVEPSGLKISCNQSSPQWNYCGGELRLAADAATLTDAGGKEYSIDELRRLSEGYWNEWQSNAHDSATR